MTRRTRLLPIVTWAPQYERTNLRSDLAAGVVNLDGGMLAVAATR